MNHKIIKSSFWIITGIELAMIIMFILFIVFCIPDCEEDNKFRTIVFGICLILLTIGVVIFQIIYLLAYLKYLRALPNDDEIKRNQEREQNLNRLAKERIDRESKRQWISDYFRLVELSKVITKKTETAQGGEKKDTMVTREIDSKEEVDLAKLEELLKHYNDQIDKHIKSE
jgi:hypothetical protein